MLHDEIYKLCAKSANSRRKRIEYDTPRSDERFAAKVCKLQSKDSFLMIP